jgi:PmbA protein
MKLQAYMDAITALPPDISQAEAQLEGQSQKSVKIQAGKVTATHSFARNAIYVRATAQRTGITYTENLAEEPFAVMRRAVENARIVSTSEEISLTPPGLAYPDLPQGKPEMPSFEALIASAQSVEKAVVSYCGDAQLADCRLAYTRYADEVANSLGLAVESTCGFYSLECQVVAEAGGRKGEKRFSLLSGSPDAFPLETVVSNAVQSAHLQATSEPVAPGVYNTLVARDAACDFLFMLWRAMSAAQNRQTGSAFAGLEGQPVGAECVSLVSSGFHPACPIHYRFDNEGMPVAPNRLMDRGVFRSLMYNRGTARKADLESTGNAGRRITMSGVIQVPLLVTPKVLYIEAGGLGREEMLSRLEDGLVIETILDSFHGIDYSSGEFSVPVVCSIVRQGQVRAASQVLVWAGNLKEVLAQTAAVGRDMQFSCFRDSFTLGAPDLLIRSQQFAGAGE